MWLSGRYTRKAVCGFDAVLELVVLSLFLVWGWWLQDLVLWATQAEKKRKRKKDVFSAEEFMHERSHRSGRMFSWQISVKSLTHSVLRNEAVISRSYAHIARGMRPSFCEVYFCFLGKHSQTDTGFKMNFLSKKGENFITSYCAVLTFKLVKIWWLVKEILVFWSIGYILFVDDDNGRKVDDSDDGWVFDSE